MTSADNTGHICYHLYAGTVMNMSQNTEFGHMLGIQSNVPKKRDKNCQTNKQRLKMCYFKIEGASGLKLLSAFSLGSRPLLNQLINLWTPERLCVL